MVVCSGLKTAGKLNQDDYPIFAAESNWAVSPPPKTFWKVNGEVFPKFPTWLNCRLTRPKLRVDGRAAGGGTDEQPLRQQQGNKQTATNGRETSEVALNIINDASVSGK